MKADLLTKVCYSSTIMNAAIEWNNCEGQNSARETNRPSRNTL